MGKKVKAMVLGDAMIRVDGFAKAVNRYLGDYVSETIQGEWESNWGELQRRRLEVEKQGPEIEVVDSLVEKRGAEAEMLMGLFVPVSSKYMEAMPNLRIVGVSRAGVENVNIKEATKRGILVFNVEGRNAEAVSDFAVGMMLAEARNIARAHYSIKNGQWRKTFSNSEIVPEFKDRAVGLVGFGYIGRLVARKFSGFNVKILVHDPFVADEDVKALGAVPVDKETLFKESDFVSVHARLTEETKNYIGKKELSLMKESAYFINTARAGLVDQSALAEILGEKKIAGAALDVFTNEPIDPASPFLALDNVTLTTHIAGTTADALNNSPGLLMEDISRLLRGEKARFIKNPEVLNDERFAAWLKEVTA